MSLTVNLISACITTLYFILPAYFSNASGLLFGRGAPVDFGKYDKNGVRWIGNGVTWKGLIAGTLIGTLTGLVQGYFAPEILQNYSQYIITPIIVNIGNGIIIGFLLGFGALVGDALESFIKRRIGIKRGEPAPILDQIDFIIVALIFVSPITGFNSIFIIISIVLTLIIHLLANTIAYLLGMKDVWY